MLFRKAETCEAEANRPHPRQGAAAIHSAVATENIPAQKLYRKMGFVFCGEADMYGHSYFLCERTIEICSKKEV